MTAEKNRDKTSKFGSKYTYMHKLYALLLSICVSFFVQLQAQGTCNPAANIIIYANYDGGNLTIDIDENVPDIRIGICTYESISVNITGTYADNVTQVLYAGYDNDGTTSVTGVDAGLVDILLYPPVTELDPDGYPYMICAYECDTNYVPGGCNTVDQAVDYFATTFGGSIRYSYMQYGVYSGTYAMSDGGNCCVGADCVTAIDAGQDVEICAGDSTTLTVTGAVNYTWSPALGLSDPDAGSTLAYPSSTTTYVITGVDADGCVGIDSITVIVHPLPEPDIDISGSTLSTGGGGTYQWYLDGTAIPGATADTYTVTENGLYSVEVTDVNGCSGFSGEVNMIIQSAGAIAMHNIVVFPNPGNAHIQFDAQNTAPLFWQIIALDGQILRSGNYNTPQKNCVLDVQDLASGVYILQVIEGDRIGTARFSVLH